MDSVDIRTIFIDKRKKKSALAVTSALFINNNTIRSFPGNLHHPHMLTAFCSACRNGDLHCISGLFPFELCFGTQHIEFAALIKRQFGKRYFIRWLIKEEYILRFSVF